MFDPKKVDLEKLKKPSQRLDLYIPEKKTDRLLYKLAHELKNNYLYVDDRFRDYDSIWRQINGFFSGNTCNLFYTMDKTHGLLGFTDIVPNRQASMMFKMWDTEIWSHTFVREIRTMLNIVMDYLNLFRVSTSTADPRIIKMSKLGGFKVEGVRHKGFVWDGKVYDETILAIVREE